MDEAPYLIELTGVPEADTGAPLPVVFANEQSVWLAFRLSYRTAPDRERNATGVIRFDGVSAHCFCSPNDEALAGHRLYDCGLAFYAFQEVKNSPWIAELCRQNSVHPFHSDAMFSRYRHFIYPFHDSTFEIVADSYTTSLHDVPPEVAVIKLVLDIE